MGSTNAGIVYDPQGPAPEAVTMTSASAMGSKELGYKMAEVYELGILRDVSEGDCKATGEKPSVEYKFDHDNPGERTIKFVPNHTGSELKAVLSDKFLTLEGELNKLAANISIGCNMAGVHYYSDYFDSARMREEISIGILQEQALCYSTDNFVMSLPTFDGDTVRIGRPYNWEPVELDSFEYEKGTRWCLFLI